ncbi:MAG: Tfp structural protein, partial [Elusimicrobia bacterium CG_4_8_14_3_um_filter_50_9]
MRSNKAFTLVELMIVISIVGMLSTIAIPKFVDMMRK